MNSYHPNLKFTYELEKVGKLSFLDILVIRQSHNKFETTVYRKNPNIDGHLFKMVLTCAKYLEKRDNLEKC